MATITIPRGIQEVRWKTANGERVTKYRIQIKRKDFQVDRFFDDVGAAKLFLEDSKTPAGRLGILKGQDRATMRTHAIEEEVANILSASRITLGNAIDSYLRVYVNPGLESTVDKVQRTAKVNKSRLVKCKEILVGHIAAGYLVPSGPFASLKEKAKGYKKVPIGSIYLDEMTEEHTTGYIRERLSQSIAKSTIKREIGAMQTCVNKLRYTDNKAWLSLKGQNPFKAVDKSLIKGGARKRRRVITEAEEETLLGLMRAYRNKEVPIIFALGLETGLRRAELLAITWEQVNLEQGFIDLEPDQSKIGEERLIPLSKEAVAAIGQLTPKDANLFHYKIEGFKTAIYRIFKGSEIENVRFHDVRRTCISRLLRDVTSSSVAIADRIGARSARSIESSMIEPLKKAAAIGKDAMTEADVMNMAGHSNKETHLGYTNIAGLGKGKKG